MMGEGLTAIILNTAGGLAIFLLAMGMMTNGLKSFGGRGLRSILRDWTSTAFRGVMCGALFTALVQSSSAVTVATIGFVNAGTLSMSHALGVIFGANVGTTMTGWLVSLVGFGFKIESFALPIIAIGVAFLFLAPRKRYKGLGEALAGFGLFFLGLAILKESFSDVAATVGPEIFDGATGVQGVVVLITIGFTITVLTQSSSAAIAIILTAASESIIGVNAAAAAIIGANIGTTSTALFSVIGATSNAKRVAIGHLIFNLLTGIVALIILPVVVGLILVFMDWAGIENNPVPLLALFHTVFNFLGVILLLPFTDRLARMLKRLFRSEDEDVGRARFLDKNVLAMPALALTAMRSEVQNLFDIICNPVLIALQGGDLKSIHMSKRSEAIFSLGDTIREFVTDIQMKDMTRDVAEDLPRVLRIVRYLEEAARCMPSVSSLRGKAESLPIENVRISIKHALVSAAQCIDSFRNSEISENVSDAGYQLFGAFERDYQTAKNTVLAAAAARTIRVEKMQSLLDGMSDCRRMVDQLMKAEKMLQIYKNPVKEHPDLS